jgi:protein-S-isoprenylcysteine O-methyltransferase Ste14
MINDGILLLCLINFGFIALLPGKFFKQNAQLSVHFWLTAAPLFAAPAFMALAFLGILPPFIGNDNPWGNAIALIGVFFSTFSILLLGMAIGTNRKPLHMFHDQQDKSASHLVTDGAYRWIRHPIYSSYLLALFAALLVCPQIGTLACYVYGIIKFSRTAAKEEERLCQSEDLGREYQEYIKHTGRFLPPLRALRLSKHSNNNDGGKQVPQSHPEELTADAESSGRSVGQR